MRRSYLTTVVLVAGVSSCAAVSAADWPAGWSPFPAGTQPAVTFLAGGKVIEVTPGRRQGTVGLSRDLATPADRILVEFSFAFSAGKGRAMNLWTREPNGTDANAINLAVNNGVLQQYSKPTGWQDVTRLIRPTANWDRPVWHRMRILADRKAEGVDYFVSAPGSEKLPAKPTATRRGYRPGLPFGSVNLAYGRLAAGARFRIRDLVIRQGGALPAPHALPGDKRTILWDPARPVPKSSQAPLLKGVRFSVVKSRRPDVDGFNWLHGAAAVWHKKRLVVSFGHNTGAENTGSEIAQGRTSTDGGKSWQPVFRIASGKGDLAVSHGVFLSHKAVLWAFHGSFHGHLKKTHTRAYVLDEQTGRWQFKGVVAEKGFWPICEPRKMPDGNWIMGGMSVGGANPAAVAISSGDDFTTWRVVVIDRAEGIGRMWGESTVIVDGPDVLNIARYGARAEALVSVSTDCGRTWSPMVRSNLPMAGSKPYAGVLSTGQRYLICTTTADAGHRRSPLTIAVTRPGKKLFCRVFRIRDAVHTGPGESGPKVRLSYPYAVEHDGSLYVVYSNDGGRGANRNSAELAVIPVQALAVK